MGENTVMEAEARTEAPAESPTPSIDVVEETSAYEVMLLQGAAY